MQKVFSKDWKEEVMGNGRSRTSNKDINNLEIGDTMYSSEDEYIKTDIDSSDLDRIGELLKNAQYSEESSLDSGLIKSLKDLDVDVVPDSTTDKYTNTPRRGFPQSVGGVSKEDLQKSRNLSIRTAYNILSTIKSLGFSFSELSLEYASSKGRVLGSFNKSLRVIDIYVSFHLGKDKFNTINNWGISTLLNPLQGNVSATTAHELGHLFDYLVTRKLKQHIAFSSTIDGKTAVSTYGNSSYKEAFAESFAMYVLGVKSVGNSDYHKDFVRAMEEMGFSSLYGCATKTYKSSSVIPSNAGVSEKSIFAKTSDNYVPIPVTTKTPTTSKVSTKHVGGSVKNIPRTASNFTKSSTSISGTIRGKKFTATITDGIRNKGYIERTVGSTKYRIDINTGAFTKIY